MRVALEPRRGRRRHDRRADGASCRSTGRCSSARCARTAPTPTRCSSASPPSRRSAARRGRPLLVSLSACPPRRTSTVTAERLRAQLLAGQPGARSRWPSRGGCWRCRARTRAARAWRSARAAAGLTRGRRRRRAERRSLAADHVAEPRHAAPRVQRGLRVAARADDAAAAHRQRATPGAGGRHAATPPSAACARSSARCAADGPLTRAQLRERIDAARRAHRGPGARAPADARRRCAG